VHPTAKRCVQWAVGLFVSGVILSAYGTDLYFRLTQVAGANAETGLGAVMLLLSLVQSTAFPLGAVLIGTAIVVQTLAPRGAPLAPGRGDPGPATPRPWGAPDDRTDRS